MVEGCIGIGCYINYIIKTQVEKCQWWIHVNKKINEKRKKNLNPLPYIKGFGQLIFNSLKLIIYSSQIFLWTQSQRGIN
jgi:hypothetical protein